MFLSLLSKMITFRPANRPILARLSRFSTQKPDPISAHFNLHDYLITTFGFTPEKAVRVAKPIANILRSREEPDAVRGFLEHHGFTSDDIKAFVTLQPRILYAIVENILTPNFRALSNMGLASSTVTEIIRSDPRVLLLTFAVPRIKFWNDLLGGDEADLVKFFKKNRGVINHQIVNNIEPKISLFTSSGLSTQDIRRNLLKASRVIMCAPYLLENALQRTKDMGFHPQSQMFVYGLQAMCRNSSELLKKKMDLLKSFGWSDDEFFSALQEHPKFLHLSEKSLKVKMCFFVEEANCDPSYIASHPRLLSNSLDKRLRPRNHVLQILKSKGVSYPRLSFYHVMSLTNETFVGRYILSYKGEISELHASYLAACASGSQ